MFPRLSEGKLRWLAKRGKRRSFQPGEVLYEHAVRDSPFYVLERGLVEFIDRKPGKDVHIAQADGGTFIGEIAAFTGEPTITACGAVERPDVIRLGRHGVGRLGRPAHDRHRGVGPGGQAGTSTRIENYLGFPTGITGTDLTRKATLQARRFDAVLSSFHRAVELADGPEGLLRVDLDDGQHVLARSVVVATGARWRELQADGVDRFRGAGVYHAAMGIDAERGRGEDVVVVGGGNSAGQAAAYLAQRARSVRVVVRGPTLKSTMSQYLVDRIKRSPQIEVMTETEVVAVNGSATVES